MDCLRPATLAMQYSREQLGPYRDRGQDGERSRISSSGRVKKILASAVTIAVLGLQLWIIVPPGRHGGWYWPFVDYPMYSGAHKATDSVMRVALRVRKCHRNAPWSLVTDSLGIPLTRFQELLYAAISRRNHSARDSSISILNQSIARRPADRGCSAEILTQAIPLATFDWTARAEPWTQALAWNVPGTWQQ